MNLLHFDINNNLLFYTKLKIYLYKQWHLFELYQKIFTNAPVYNLKFNTNESLFKIVV